MKGAVESYDLARRYGFIRGEDGLRYVVHSTDIARPPLRPGELVVFHPRNTPRGLQAIKVRRGSLRQMS
jgi:cold shock CspA family protein